MPVDKYGVEEELPADKTATEQLSKCPSCGTPLRPVEDTGVSLCPKCGSKPFEKKGSR